MIRVFVIVFGMIAWSVRLQAQYDFSSVEKLLRDSLNKFDGGCSLLLMQDGKIMYEKNFGHYTADTVIPIASASKWLAGAVFMTLCDEGRLSPKDSVRKFLPYFTDDKACITLRHVFSHTSGLPGEVSAMRNLTLTMKLAAQKIGSEKLLYKPGSAFLYGGGGMQIAGRVMEIASGQKAWQTLFDERIAKPLGMVNTNFYALGKTDNPLLGGGAQSSAREFSRFLQMLMNKGVWNGKRILSETAIAEMHKDQTNGIPVMLVEENKLVPHVPPEKANYGFGVWRISNALTGELIELNSQGRYGFSPWIDVKRGMIGILSTRTPLKTILPTYKRMKNLICEAVPIRVQTAEK